MKVNFFGITVIFIFSQLIVMSQNQILLEDYRLGNQIDSLANIKGEQFASWQYSMIGLHSKAMELFEGKTVHQYGNIANDKFFLKDALYVLDSISKLESAIFINEAHHISRHRNFVRHLLPILYKNGFRYLGAEAINQMDTLLNERGYPLKTTGFYIKDPEFGELVRDALELGFIVFGYEASAGKQGKEREIEQARNIIRQSIDIDSNAKILILAGFDHIREDSNFISWEKSMAGRFLEFSGTNPFTIDQVQFTPAFNDKNTNPLLRRLSILKPSVPICSIKIFTNPYSDKRFDLYIFHPPTKEILGVSDWKYSFERIPYNLKIKNRNENEQCLVLGYSYNEWLSNDKSTKLLIPKDIVLIDGVEKPLLLKSGKYLIEVKNSQGVMQTDTVLIESK
jgi:hypothetical protein